MTAQVGDQVRLLDRSGDVRGVVRAISSEPYRTLHPIQVQLATGRGDSRYWFGEDELEVLK
jgi:hypothetical protein